MFPFSTAALLGLEAQKVIELRPVKLAWGGAAAQAEAHLMTGEKVLAATEAISTLMQGG